MKRIALPLLLVVLAWSINSLGIADQTDKPQQDGSQIEDRKALGRLQTYVGDWRGVGQPKRGSAKDAWSEECSWAWDFTGEKPVLTLKSPNGKFAREGTLTAAEHEGQYRLVLEDDEGREPTYVGKLNDDGSLILEADATNVDAPDRITMRFVAGGDRMLVLYERKLGTDRYSRLAEVGMTRKGSGFGKGTTGIECVVTGGTGTIAVEYEGKTYYVCCTGCRDYFNDNPAEVLADYRAKKEAEKAERENDK